MIFAFAWIPGLMFGLEFPDDPDVHFVLDLGIIRMIILKYIEEEE